MKRKHLTFQFKLATHQTKDATEECIIEGYANTSDKDRVGDVVLPSAFEKSLPTYMSNPVLLANHDWNDPCGVVTSAEVQDKGLFIQAKVSATRPDIKTLIREGVLRTFSIGYNELDADMDEATQTKFIKSLELLEISIVTVPANANALFREVGANLPKDGDKQTDAPKPNEGEPKAAKPGVTKELMEVGVKALTDSGVDKDQAILIAYKVCGEGKSSPTAESFKALTGFIGDVQDALGEEKLDGKQMAACVDHFTKSEEIMTKAELLAVLRQKSAPVPTPSPTDGSKDSAAPAAEAPAQDSGNADLAKMLEALMARVDALGEAMAKLLEGEQQEDGAKPADEPKKDEADQEKPKGDESKDGAEAIEQMSEDDAQKAIAELEAQIRQLEDDGNE